MKKPFEGVLLGAVWGRPRVVEARMWLCVGLGPYPGSGSRPGRRAAACLFWLPPLEDDACHDEHLHAPILRGAWVPPHEDDACHDEHNGGGGGGGGGDQPCAWSGARTTSLASRLSRPSFCDDRDECDDRDRGDSRDCSESDDTDDSSPGRVYEEAGRVGLKECARDQTCVSWCSRCPGAQDCLP